MWPVVAVVAIGVPMLVSILLLTKLREHRIDLSRGQSVFEGSSRVWQVNVLRPSNYTSEGRRILRWYVVSQLAVLAGFAFALKLFSWS